MATGFTARQRVVIKASAKAVWKALIDPAMVKEYLFGTTVSSSWKVGAPITWTGEWQGKRYEDKGEVRQFVEERELEYTYWSGISGLADLPENYALVRFTLEGRDGEIALSMTQDNNPTEEARAHSESNWGVVLGKLKELVERRG